MLSLKFNLVFRGFNFAVTQFVTPFAHVFRHLRACSKKNLILEKTFLKILSQICVTLASLSTKILFLSAKKQTSKRPQSLADSSNKTCNLSGFLRHYI